MPARSIALTESGGELVPAWYSDHDRPWLRELIADLEACEGRSITELVRRFRSTGDPRGGRRTGPARHLVLRCLRRTRPAVLRAALRREVFAEAARGGPRAVVLARVAARHGTTAAAIESELFSDLPGERPVAWPAALRDPGRLVLALNLAIAQGMVRCASDADLMLHGASRAVLRTAWLHGAGFEVSGSSAEGVRLRWVRSPSRRGLVALVPVLPWARRFRLRARCRLQGTVGTFVLDSHDPILPGPEPRTFDSALERRFAADVAAVPEWELLREPMPLTVHGSLAFPDFLLRRRSSGAEWLVEIAGLRDRAALAGKLAALAVAPRLCLCLPRHLVPDSHRDHPRVVAFDRRVPAVELLERLTRLER